MESDFRKNIQVICNKAEEILVVKNHKYGNSFDSTRDKYGSLSYVLRLDDKLSRVHTLSNNNDEGTIDESIEDTLIDIIGYTVLELIYRKAKSEEKDTAIL